MAQGEAEVAIGPAVPSRLAGRYDIYADRALPDLRSPNAGAFAAIDRERPGDQVFALVCDVSLPPRIGALEAMQQIRLDSILCPIAWGSVFWPMAGRNCFAIIYPRPGARVMPSLTQPMAPLNEDDIIHFVLPPIIVSLREFFLADQTHRAIRATNFFYRDSTRRLMTLGDCCTAPPGALQPAVYETIESAMASPTARGKGDTENDLYALGVSLVHLVLGRNPTAQMSDSDLLREKINRGSFAAVIGGDRISLNMQEAVRGLLIDDPRDRWSLQDLDLWVQGRHMPPRQGASPKRAARDFEFNGQGYFSVRPIAEAFTRDPIGAARVARGPEFDAWMERSLQDEPRQKALRQAVSENQEGGIPEDERLTARIAIALDPEAPIRFKAFAAMPDGIGAALASAFYGVGSIPVISEVIQARLPQFWCATQAKQSPEYLQINKTFEKMRRHLDDKKAGFGIERVLYELNPKLHCLSPLVETEYVTEPGDLLRALEQVLQSRPDDLIIDRHFAAFVAARSRFASHDWIEGLASSDIALRSVAMVQMLSRLQAGSGPRAVPNLAQRLIKQLTPAVERFRHRPHRTYIYSQLPKIAQRGNLTEMLQLIDNANERYQDSAAFNEALREYAMVQRLLEALQAEGPTRPMKAAELGGQMATVTASFLSWVVMLAAIVIMR